MREETLKKEEKKKEDEKTKAVNTYAEPCFVGYELAILLAVVVVGPMSMLMLSVVG